MRDSSPFAHNSLLTIRSSSASHMIPLYVMLGIFGAVFALVALSLTSRLGGCCCSQARKAYQTVAGNRRQSTVSTDNHGHWHGHSSPSSNAPSTNASREDATGPRSTHHIQAAPSEKASPSTTRTLFDEHQTPASPERTDTPATSIISNAPKL